MWLNNSNICISVYVTTASCSTLSGNQIHWEPSSLHLRPFKHRWPDPKCVGIVQTLHLSYWIQRTGNLNNRKTYAASVKGRTRSPSFTFERSIESKREVPLNHIGTKPYRCLNTDLVHYSTSITTVVRDWSGEWLQLRWWPTKMSPTGVYMNYRYLLVRLTDLRQKRDKYILTSCTSWKQFWWWRRLFGSRSVHVCWVWPPFKPRTPWGRNTRELSFSV